jgi:uncharacterized NAD(P)/FAD-binding protein YdhS
VAHVTIIGAGFCGTMSAVYLLRTSRAPIHIRLVEKNPAQIGRGVAYSTREDYHLLNTPAGRMSALPNDPDHFVHWIERRNELTETSWWPTGAVRDAYLPRRCYGDYLAELLHDTIKQSSQHTVELVADEVISVDAQPTGDLAVRTKSGACWGADACVLALGNAEPTAPPSWDADSLPSTHYHSNPWAKDLIPALLESDSCALLGSGLTMLDVVMALHGHDYRGTIHVISRRGLVPLPHGRPATSKLVPLAAFQPAAARLRDLLAELRLAAQQPGTDEAGWQAVIDSLRPNTATFWQLLTTRQQKQFLRHVRPYWDHHRHRVAPIVRRKFDELVTAGQVCLHYGRVAGLRTVASSVVTLEAVVSMRNGRTETLGTDHIVNCTGPASLHQTKRQTLVKNLLNAYPWAIDRLQMGLAVTPDMRLATDAEEGGPLIFVAGPPVKGQLWECTAVPECRQAAANIAATVHSSLAVLTAHATSRRHHE